MFMRVNSRCAHQVRPPLVTSIGIAQALINPWRLGNKTVNIAVFGLKEAATAESIRNTPLWIEMLPLI